MLKPGPSLAQRHSARLRMPADAPKPLDPPEIGSKGWSAVVSRGGLERAVRADMRARGRRVRHRAGWTWQFVQRWCARDIALTTEPLKGDTGGQPP